MRCVRKPGFKGRRRRSKERQEVKTAKIQIEEEKKEDDKKEAEGL